MKYRAISVAEKKADYARRGEAWPTYPDGTGQLWEPDAKCRAGGSFRKFPAVGRRRERDRAYSKLPESRKAHKRASLKCARKRRGSAIPLDAPPLTPSDSARRGGNARADQALDDAIARYEEELAKYPRTEGDACLFPI